MTTLLKTFEERLLECASARGLRVIDRGQGHGLVSNRTLRVVLFRLRCEGCSHFEGQREVEKSSMTEHKPKPADPNEDFCRKLGDA